MGLLDSLIATLTGHSATEEGAAQHPLGAALSSLLAQNGGIQGLMSKFSQGGLGEVFSSWVGLGENQSVSPDQISRVLGPEQVNSLASSLGVDSAQASGFLADYLPKIIDKLTPKGEVDAGADASSSLAELLPSLLSGIGGGQGRA